MVVAQCSIGTGNIQLKATSRQCKSKKQKKEDTEQKPTEITEKKPIVKYDKLVTYNGPEEVVESDETRGDLYSPMSTMLDTEAYTHLQTARRGKPFRQGARGRCTRGRLLGNLKMSPNNITQDFEQIEEQQYASNIIPDAETHVDTEMPYEDWLAAEGLFELQQLPPKDKNDEENWSMIAKHIDSIHITLDVIYKFIKDTTISYRDSDKILRKLSLIYKCLEDKTSTEIDMVEKKDGAAVDCGAKVPEMVKDNTKEAIGKVERKEGEAGDGGMKVQEFIKDDTKEVIGKVERKEGEAGYGSVKVQEFVKDDTKEVIGKVERKQGEAGELDKVKIIVTNQDKVESTVAESSVKEEDMRNSSAKMILKKEEKGTAENAKGFIKTLRKVNFNEKEEVYNVHIEEDDSNNDTDLVIDENVNVGEFPLSENNSIEDSDDDSYLHIPLSQIKNEERMVQYHESLQHETESDEFSLGTEEDNTKEEAEVVTEIIKALDDRIKSVKNREITDEMIEVGVGTSVRTEGVGKTDEGKDCCKNVADQHG